MARRLTILGLSAALAISAASVSFALDEQQMAAPPAASGSADAAKAGVQTSAPAAKQETGTEIRIPGLGRLGTLPKMDFGLELLYGAAEDQPAEQKVPLEDQPDDLTVRGSVKHNF